MVEHSHGEPDPNATRERYEGDTQERFWDNAAQVLFSNIKRTFDEYQAIALTAHQRSQEDFDELRSISRQHIQNAVGQSDALAKASIDHVRSMQSVTNKDHLQATRHADIAIENQWESAEEVTQSVTLAAILSSLAGAFSGDDATLGRAARAVAAAVKS